MKILLLPTMVLSLLATPQQPQDSETENPATLAEAARRARELRRDSENEVRTITNEDLGGLSQARVSRSSSSRSRLSRPSTLRGVPDAETGSEVLVDETTVDTDLTAADGIAFWRQAFGEARLNLQNAVNRHLVLQLRMNNIRNAFYNEDDGITQALLQGEMQDTVALIDSTRNEIIQAREALTLLQRKAQVAGLTPGEIRDLTGEIPETVEIVTPETPTP